MTHNLQPAQHLDPDQITAFMDDALPPHERDQTLAHLALCPTCREILHLAQPPAEEHLPAPAPKPRLWTILWPATAALVAAVLLVTVTLRRTTPKPQPPTQTAKAVPPTPIQPNPHLPTPQTPNPTPKTAPSAGAIAPPAKVPAKPLATNQNLATTMDHQIVENLPYAERSSLDSVQLVPGAEPKAAAPPTAPQPTAHPAPPPNIAAGDLLSDDAGLAAPSAQTQAQPAVASPWSTAPSPSPAPQQFTLAVRSAGLQGASNARAAASVVLPSGLHGSAMVSSGSQSLALDTALTLFRSSDGGRHWQAVATPWQGAVAHIQLVSVTAFVAGQASAGAPAPPRARSATSADSIARTGITGAITDQSGAVIPHATVVLAGPVTRTLQSDATGQYLVPDLPPGSYAVSAEYPGFARQTLPAVSVNASSLTQANLTLHVGSVSQTVTVAAASDLLAIEGASAYHGAITPAPASVFEAVTATGEHWTSPDGLIWTLK